MFDLIREWEAEPPACALALEDYEGNMPRWCAGCGDHGVLGALQRLASDERLPPEKTVVVSGIGCSSRLPHYFRTFGFHSLHGRPLPVACGIRSRRPDLHIFVVTGDGDCCAIGTAHWIHAIRYNMKMTVMLLDNNIYGLTKMQSSPTTRLGRRSNTHPRGTSLGPLNPLSVTLGIENASFVAQTVDWNAAHLYSTIRTAHQHQGLAFVRILQRCPHFVADNFEELRNEPSLFKLLMHENGIPVDERVQRLYPNHCEHDPRDRTSAMVLAADEGHTALGLLYRSESGTRYDKTTESGLGMSNPEKLEAVQVEIDRFAL